MRFVALIAAAALLGACVMPAPAPSPYPIVHPVPHPTPEPIVRPVPQPAPHPIPRDPRPRRGEREGCNAAQYQHLVGGPLPDPFPRRGTVRVYRSDMSVTMEYDPDRLNVEIHPATRRIVSITCG